MRKVFLVTGFNNWGKTTLINNLFGKSRFFKHQAHKYAGKDFCVIPQSNDDLGEVGYIQAYSERIKILSDNGITSSYIFSAFCPTKELENQSARIISTIYKNDEVHVLPIVFKWCGHAFLDVKEISNHYSSLNNVMVHPINAPVPGAPKLAELQAILLPLL